MTDYEKEFIKRVRKEIALFHLSQDAVGNLIGMSRQSLSKLLNCKVDSIRADTMLKLARVFSISIDEIVGLEEAKKEAEKIASEFVAHEVERAQLQVMHYNRMAQRVRDLGYNMPDFPVPDPPLPYWTSNVLAACVAAINGERKEKNDEIDCCGCDYIVYKCWTPEQSDGENMVRQRCG